MLGEEENIKANYFGKTLSTICRQGLGDTLRSAVLRILSLLYEVRYMHVPICRYSMRYIFRYVLYAEYGTICLPVCDLCEVQYRTCTGMCSMLSAVPHMCRYVLYAECGTCTGMCSMRCAVPYMYRYVLYAECGTVHVPVCALCRVRYHTCTGMCSLRSAVPVPYMYRHML